MRETFGYTWAFPHAPLPKRDDHNPSSSVDCSGMASVVYRFVSELLNTHFNGKKVGLLKLVTCIRCQRRKAVDARERRKKW